MDVLKAIYDLEDMVAYKREKSGIQPVYLSCNRLGYEFLCLYLNEKTGVQPFEIEEYKGMKIIFSRNQIFPFEVLLPPSMEYKLLPWQEEVDD
jgi:hypothetical protein